MFEAQSYTVTKGGSPWRLTHEDATLIDALADGVAEACAETGLVRAETAEGWRAARAGARVEIGHLDLFARPR